MNRRISNRKISDSGRWLSLDIPMRDYSKLTSRPKEFIDLGCKLIVKEKTGEQLFTYDFGSNVEDYIISPDGETVYVATLGPDNSIYCFDMTQKKLLWKYKNHSKKLILGLELSNNNNNINIYTGKTISTMGKDYVLKKDGTLTDRYAKQQKDLDRIKKQPPEEKATSLIDLINTREKQNILQGLLQLTSFVTTKSSLPYHTRISDSLRNHIQTKDEEIFDMVWKVIMGILKKQPQVVEPLVPLLLSKFNMSNITTVDLLWYLDKLGEINPSWIRNEIPLIKQKLSSESLNERRFAAFALGSIGSNDVSLVEDVIPLMIEYISNSDLVSETSSFDIDGTWLRDACIDAIGKIGKNFPRSVNEALPVLESLSYDTVSPYTIKKAKKAIASIQGFE